MPARKYTEKELEAALAVSPNMRQLLIALGMSPRGGNYESVRRRIAVLGLDDARIRSGKLPVYSDEELRVAIRASRSFAEVLRKLGRSSGSSRYSLKRRVTKLGLDTSHFIGQRWRRGARVPVTPPVPLQDLLVLGRWYPPSKLRVRLIATELKQAKCEACGLTRWNGKPVPLELDHVNGRRDDNRIENLRIICPNCHAQTPTYRGRNIGAADRIYPESSSPGVEIG